MGWSTQQAVLLVQGIPNIKPKQTRPLPTGEWHILWQGSQRGSLGLLCGPAWWGHLTLYHLGDIAVWVNAANVFWVGWVGAAVKNQGCGREGRELWVGLPSYPPPSLRPP